MGLHQAGAKTSICASGCCCFRRWYKLCDMTISPTQEGPITRIFINFLLFWLRCKHKKLPP
ncbi:Uncharacterised protein [Vibrio cholerae]|nr:Uncharacterised protein [Vibrio cholerae]